MALIDELTALSRTQGVAAATRLVEQRAEGGDAEALAMLGQWRLWGLYGPRDGEAGFAATMAAAALGDVEAAYTAAALLATGTGTVRSPSAARDVIAGMPLDDPLARRQLELTAAEDASDAVPETLRETPWVARVPTLLSTAECSYLIERATPMMRPSTVIDPVSRQRVAHPVRNSDGWSITPPYEDIVVHAINCRIARLTNTHWEQGEPLHVLRYRPGQQFRPHCDALPGVTNQRVLTVIVYLNDEYDGGETDFDGSLRFRGGAGDAVLFTNVGKDGRADPATRHAGLPVTGGTKWVATRWIRAAAYDPWTPGS